MKTIARKVAALVVASSFLTLAACGGNKPADAKDADDATEASEDKPKKGLEAMKGDRMEKADAEE